MLLFLLGSLFFGAHFIKINSFDLLTGGNDSLKYLGGNETNEKLSCNGPPSYGYLFIFAEQYRFINLTQMRAQIVTKNFDVTFLIQRLSDPLVIELLYVLLGFRVYKSQ